MTSGPAVGASSQSGGAAAAVVFTKGGSLSPSVLRHSSNISSGNSVGYSPHNPLAGLYSPKALHTPLQDVGLSNESGISDSPLLHRFARPAPAPSEVMVPVPHDGARAIANGNSF